MGVCGTDVSFAVVVMSRLSPVKKLCILLWTLHWVVFWAPASPEFKFTEKLGNFELCQFISPLSSNGKCAKHFLFLQ